MQVGVHRNSLRSKQNKLLSKSDTPAAILHVTDYHCQQKGKLEKEKKKNYLILAKINWTCAFWMSERVQWSDTHSCSNVLHVSEANKSHTGIIPDRWRTERTIIWTTYWSWVKLSSNDVDVWGRGGKKRNEKISLLKHDWCFLPGAYLCNNGLKATPIIDKEFISPVKRL